MIFPSIEISNAEAILRWEWNDRVVHGLHEIHEVAGRRQSAEQVLTQLKFANAVHTQQTPFFRTRAALALAVSELQTVIPDSSAYY